MKGAQNFWPLLRQPQIAGPVTVNTAFNDYFTNNAAFTRQIGTGKVDWNRNDRHTIWAKWTLQEANVSQPMEFGDAGGSNGFTGFIRTQTATVGHTWTLSPQLVLTGHVGFSKQRTDTVAGIHGKPLGQTLLGVPGTNEPVSDDRYSGLPAIYLSGWNTLGNADSSTPYTRRDWTFNIPSKLSS